MFSNLFNNRKKQKEQIERLLHGDWSARRGACESLKSLGKISDPELLQTLILLLKEEDGNEYFGAKEVLEAVCPNWGETEGARQLLPDFIGALENEEEGYYPHGAIYALRKIKDNRVIQPLMKWVKISYKFGSSDLCNSAILALGEKKEPLAVDLLIKVLSLLDINKPKFVRADQHAAAAWALGEIGDIRSIYPLIEVLEAEDDYIRWCAENSLTKFGHSALKPLIAALSDHSSDKIRCTVASVLGRINSIAAVEPLINALEDKYDVVQYLASVSLKKILGEGHVENTKDWKNWWNANKGSFKKVDEKPEIDPYIKENFFST